MRSLLAIIALLVACEGETHRANVVISKGTLGFQCVLDDDPSTLLAERFLEREVASVVVDYVRLGGFSGCRTGQILDWCDTHDCLPIAEHRVCVDLNIANPNAGNQTIANEIVDQLSGRLLTSEAQKEPVIIRAVVVANSCSEVPTSGDLNFECQRLLGCVYSCPVPLGELNGDVVLDLDTFDNRCQRTVEVCASSSGFGVANDYCE